MQAIPVKSYDARIDSKKRITLRNTLFEYFNVKEFADGTIVLEPRELTKPFTVSSNTLSMMDKSMENFNFGDVSDPIDISVYGDVH
ncbi:hypothetical protein E4N80_05770 [Treponema denticola]|uniref:hypothetical protein n=1 Tax=Treponema denticola TaxID=158 RepID=UPI0020A2AF34|nr:hypothetical protein [Treponema denticola]UTD05013.1 hypothetical protein E4N80_05770 [Treponema denticola]